MASHAPAQDGAPVPSRPRPAGRSVRVLVVDDSMTARTVFSRIIERDPALELAGQARNAETALDLLAAKGRQLAVDVILLDLEMPGMGGLRALPELIAKSGGARVLVVSSLAQDGAQATVAAMAQGAADTLPKPQSGQFDQAYRALLCDRIRQLGTSTDRQWPHPPRQAPAPALRKVSARAPRVLALGASTGGIHALGQFFAALPRRIGLPILVTQHLPASFMEAFARQVQLVSGREATLAAEGSLLEADRVLIAPGDAHICVAEMNGQLLIRLDRQPAASGCMPSVDPMFASLAQVLGAQALGVVLSGMGRDGTAGAGQIVAAGGTVLAQDEASCAVWGMPGSVVLAGLASAVQGPAELACRVAAQAGKA